MQKNLANTKYVAHTGLVAIIVLVMGTQVAFARTTPCGQFDTTYGYYGQCDANNQPIAGAVTTPPVQPAATNPVNTNTNTGYNNSYSTGSNYSYNTGTTYTNTTGGTYNVNQYGYETTTQTPTVGCNVYDNRQGGYVVCDATGHPTGYWISSQNSGGGTNNITVNYSNPQTNTQSPAYYGNNTSSASSYNIGSGYDYGIGYNYGNTGYNYGYVNSGYVQPTYYYQQPTTNFWGQLAVGLLGYALSNNNSCSSCYSGGYDYGNTYYTQPYSTYNTYTTPSYYTNESWYTTDYVNQGTNYYGSGGHSWDTSGKNYYGGGGLGWED